MKTLNFKVLFLGMFFIVISGAYAQKDEIQTYKVDKSIKVQKASPEAVEAFKDKRFGMFIHWGPISQMGKQLSHSRNSASHKTGGKPYKKADIEPEVYDVQYKTFNPTKYNPDYIVDLAKRAGMKYLVFTAKHHAGFSMFDSKVSDYDIMSAPYGKDILKELEQACRKEDFDFGFYYSPRDWYNKDCDSDENHYRYITFYKAQMDELLTNYGKISEIWFDGLGPGDWKNTSAETMARIRELHPDAMVNDRGGVGADFYTPEHTVSWYNNEQLWEACHTTTGQWGYNPDVGAKKLPELMKILLYTWGADGNMLLNIGPRGDGSLNPIEVERLEQIATWWSINGEKSIEGSRGGPYFPSNWGTTTRKGNKVFLHVFNWNKDNTLTLPNFPNKTIKKVSLLNGNAISIEQNKDTYTLTIPKKSKEKIVTTVEVELENSAMNIEAFYSLIPLTHQATFTASQNEKDLKSITDGDATTVWHASGKNKKDIWVEATFKTPVTIASVVAGRGEEWVTKNNPELQIPDGNGSWKTVYKWKPKFEPVKFLKEPVTTDKIRLKVKNTKDYFLAEFELYAPIK
jgi:alpha-L-fucosidase